MNTNAVRTKSGSSTLTIKGCDGVALHAVESGDGPLMLFLHGFPEFSGAWYGQLNYFGAGARAVAIDLRGYNRSDKPTDVEEYRMPKLVEDIRLAVEQLGNGTPAIIVGHDWGGIIGWAFAREHPDLLRGLVAINAPHPAIFARELATNPAQRFASSHRMLFRSPEVAEEILSEFDFALLKRMLFRRTSRPEAFTSELRANYVASWKQPGALRAALHYYQAWHNFQEIAGQDWTIKVPTRVLWGETDPFLLTSNLSGLDNYVSHLSVERHPSATHWVVHEEPQWVNEQIEAFVDEL